jgi:hypothetical protein
MEELGNFQTYLYELGLLTWHEKIDTSTPTTAISGLVNSLALKKVDELYDIAERIFHTWLDRRFDCGLKKLDQVDFCMKSRRVVKKFFRWRHP